MAALVAVLGGLVVGTAPGSAPLPPATPVGVGPGFSPPPYGDAVREARPVGRLRCRRPGAPVDLVHVEIFVHGRVLLLPPGIGVAPPVSRDGARVLSGRCLYALRTLDPTGVVEVERGTRATLGDLFAVWGAPLSATRLLGFATPADDPVRVYLGGRRVQGDPRRLPLEPRDEIVIELGSFVPPHRAYHFPDGR